MILFVLILNKTIKMSLGKYKIILICALNYFQNINRHC